MSADNQQERPIYRLQYKVEARDDYVNSEKSFFAKDDNDARQKALSFIEKLNAEDRKMIKAVEKSSCDYVIYKPLKLERVAYVMKEVEETTRVSLQGDIASRVRSGTPVELSELANL